MQTNVISKDSHSWVWDITHVHKQLECQVDQEGAIEKIQVVMVVWRKEHYLKQKYTEKLKGEVKFELYREWGLGMVVLNLD